MTSRPCNGGRTLAEFWRCDRLIILLAIMYLTMAATNPWELPIPLLLRILVAGCGVLLLVRRFLRIPRYATQLVAAIAAVGISATFALSPHPHWGLALGWLVIAALQTAELRE